ncbi:MAG: MFS transporter [Candidatus Cloacimonadaceae bacterium]|nr:MFS transporter [Candidatus Cloacimonadaceae bacterium]
MTKYFSCAASFGIMLCLGGVYAWSIFAAELQAAYGFSATQTQMIFGTHIAVFPVTMIFANMLKHRTSDLLVSSLSAILLSWGYIMAGTSGGAFDRIFIGIGVIAGIGTGLGYFIALTTPVEWFHENKGLITGIAAAGFSLSAVILANVTELLLNNKIGVLQIFTGIGIVYGVVILGLSPFLKSPPAVITENKRIRKANIVTLGFFKLLLGIFCGTFAGLIIIGNLKQIGLEHGIESRIILQGLTLFAVSNFAGRLIWGAVSDYIGSKLCIILALTLQAVSIYYIGFTLLPKFAFLIFSALIGFGFGANFVLFVKETSKAFGHQNLGYVYPYVFLGFAAAVIVGPLLSGTIFDFTGNYSSISGIAITLSLVGATLFLIKGKIVLT